MLTRREVPVERKFEMAERLWRTRPKILNTSHQVYLGDAREMRELTASESVHLVVTSPPYWNLKRYHGAAGDRQLGHLDDRYEFLESLKQVWQRCFDLLVPGGRLCIVVGDVCRSRRANGRHLVEPLHAYLQVQLQKLDFDPLAPIIWSKISNMRTEVTGNGAGFLGKPYEPNGIVKNDIEFILLFRKPGGYRHPTSEQRLLSLISKEDHSRWFQQIWADVPGEVQRGHPAPFPTEIARRLIGMFSFVGDTVLDPFLGTGNTTLAAIEMHRSSLGYEIEPAYFEMAKRKLAQSTFLSEVTFGVGN